jgi:excisionase family DNA binding protein
VAAAASSTVTAMVNEPEHGALPEHDWLTPAEAAVWLRVGERTVVAAIRAERLPALCVSDPGAQRSLYRLSRAALLERARLPVSEQVPLED